MTEIKFTINGNQDDPRGNPMGYKRTLNHSWRADSTKYVKWCEYVRKHYQIYGIPIVVREGAKDYLKKIKHMKPFTTSRSLPLRMDLEIEFANDVRPDPDNVFKGIADALFENDKYLMAGSFTSRMSEDKKGRVIVRINEI